MSRSWTPPVASPVETPPELSAINQLLRRLNTEIAGANAINRSDTALSNAMAQYQNAMAQYQHQINS